LVRSYPEGLGFNPETTSSTSPGIPAEVAKLQNLVFDYDGNRNLRSRVDQRNPAAIVTDTFDYDGLNRLSHWTSAIPGTTNVYEYQYDAKTNLNHRMVNSGPGTAQHFNHEGTAAPTGPNAITSGTAGNFTYEGPGLRKTGGGRTVDYNSDHLPALMTLSGVGQIAYKYDAFGGRMTKSSPQGSTTYAKGYERRTESGHTLHIFQIPGDERVVGQIVWEEQNGVITSESYEYIHDDHLGSTETVSGEGASPGQGAEVGRLRYDPFGAQVRPDNPLVAATGMPGNVRRGYTGHEAEQDSGLINMGGRIYDPATAHFLTADPFVSEPGNPLAFNRFGYAMNNPTSMIDPSGFWSIGLSSSIGGSGGGFCFVVCVGPTSTPPPHAVPPAARGAGESSDDTGGGRTTPRTDVGGGRATISTYEGAVRRPLNRSEMPSAVSQGGSELEAGLRGWTAWQEPVVRSIGESSARIQVMSDIISIGVVGLDLAAGMMAGSLRVTASSGRLVPRLSVVRALRDFGLDRAARRTFFSGQAAGFEAKVAGRPYSYLQYADGALQAGIIEIDAVSQGVPAFLQFVRRSGDLARMLGLSSVDIAGIAVGNPGLAASMIRSGFRPFTLEMPAILGGGHAPGLIRTLPLR
jgi:RHS repeat-associated protein